MRRVYRVIVTRFFIGIIAYLCFVQPNLWKYTLETFAPSYATVERIVSAQGIVLCREETVDAPVSGVLLKMKEDSAKVSKGEVLAVIFPTAEDYKNYLKEVNAIVERYDSAIKEKNALIEGKKEEIKKVYEELTREGNILNSLVTNRQDITDVIDKIRNLNSRIVLLKNEMETLTGELEGLKREKEQKIAELKQKIITSNITVVSRASGLVSFEIDGREYERNAVIEKGIEGNTDLSLNSLIKQPRVISSGDFVRRGETIAKTVDNLEQFVLLDVTLDGKLPIILDRFSVNVDGKVVEFQLMRRENNHFKELWFCKIKSLYYIGLKGLNLNIKVGTAEGLVVPRSLLKKEGERYFVYVIGNNSVEKRFVEILGGNQKEVVVNNISRGELLLVD
jgi:hypothetical protein